MAALSRGDRSVSVAASEADITRASVEAMVNGSERLPASTADVPTPADD